jgi:pimeloyl-ACP methyl ester carboxylesterase
MEAAQTQLIDIGEGASLFVERTGNGPAILFVAGLGDDHTLFDPLVDRMRDQFTCITFDHRGSGASSALPEGSSLVTLADDAHRLLEQLGRGPVIVVGSSMGGAVAQEWVLRHPADVAALVLISAWARPRRHLLGLVDHWTALHDAGEIRWVVQSLALFALSPGAWDEDPETVAALLSADTLAPGFMVQLRASARHDTLARLGEIHAPTLIMAGTHDLLVSPDNASELHHAIAGSVLASVASGHVPFWEAPDEAARIIREFVVSV